MSHQRKIDYRARKLVRARSKQYAALVRWKDSGKAKDRKRFTDLTAIAEQYQNEVEGMEASK